MRSDEIDYKIVGQSMQLVEVTLDQGETVIAEAGAMNYMEDGIEFETKMGDGSDVNQGFMGKLFSAGKRMMSGESLFMTHFSNHHPQRKTVAFAAPFPGSIIGVDLADIGGGVTCQKDAFLCAALGTKIDITFNKRLGSGFFGGEGFIMEKLEGDGMAFVHAGGTIAKKVLQAGEVLKVDTACIVGFTQDIDSDIEFAGGIKNTIFGGEGLFFAKLQGPGTVYIQSLSFSRLAGRVLAMAPQTGRGDKGEGSILGGIGDILDGDNRF